MAKSIQAIQARLRELGILKADVDGRMGPLTKAAIRGFQRINGLGADGVVGPKTEAALWPAPMPEREAPVAVVAPPATRQVWPRQADVAKFYGPVGQNQTMLLLPYPMRLAWEKRSTVHRFSIHEKVHDSAKRCFERIADAYDEKKRADTGIDLFGGCLNVRKMRGGSAWSMHSWGIAIDFDPARNQLKWGKDKARLAKPDCDVFWRIWEEEGWLSLGRARGYDFMHIQAARL